MKKVLICGDSFGVTDPDYPDQHWSERLLNTLPDIEIINLSMGGASNALIAMQLSQGLRLDPDCVVFLFTSSGRYEYDKDLNIVPVDITSESLTSYLKKRYTTNMYDDQKEKNKNTLLYHATVSSPNIEKIKNYFYIMYCLQTCALNNKPFCYSLGGFSYRENSESILNRNFMINGLNQFRNQEILVNLWEYAEWKSERPYFHVTDPSIQTLFSNQIKLLLRLE